MKNIVVYTKNNCQPCRLTKRELGKLEIPFEERNIDENPEFAKQLAAEGWKAAPVVKIEDGESWSGFNLQKLRALK